MASDRRPRPARDAKEAGDGQLGVREADGVRTIGGWFYKNSRLLDDEEAIANAVGRRWGWYSPVVLVYLTTKRIVCLPERMSLIRPEDGYLATLRRVAIYREKPYWFWRVVAAPWFGPARWFSFETASDRLTFVTSEPAFYEAVLEMAAEKAWNVDDTTT